MSTFKQEIEDYIKTHKIKELFDHLSCMLMYFKPQDPVSFMCNILLDMKDALEQKETVAVIYSDESLRAYFRLLDPVEEGHITVDQLKSALMVLGVDGDSISTLGEGPINVDMFVEVAKREIQKKF